MRQVHLGLQPVAKSQSPLGHRGSMKQLMSLAKHSRTRLSAARRMVRLEVKVITLLLESGYFLPQVQARGIPAADWLSNCQ